MTGRALRRARRAGVLALVVVSIARAAAAQGNYEIQVYPSELIPPRHTMFELHSNFTPKGIRNPPDGTQPTDKAFHETLEVTHGFTDWFEVGFYQFTSLRAGEGWQWVGSHIRPRVSVPARLKWPVGVSFSQEIGYQRAYFSPDAWTWELRPIIDQQVGPLYWSVNLAFERALTGEGAHKGFDFSPAAKISCQATPKVSFGVEYYGGVGAITHLDPARSQQHQVFPAIDLDLSPDFEFNAGVGIGLTRSTDQVLVKVIVGYRMPF